MTHPSEKGEGIKPSAEFTKFITFIAGCSVRGYKEDALSFLITPDFIEKIREELLNHSILTAEQGIPNSALYNTAEDYLNEDEVLVIEQIMTGGYVLMYMYETGKEYYFVIEDNGNIAEINNKDYQSQYENMITSSHTFEMKV